MDRKGVFLMRRSRKEFDYFAEFLNLTNKGQEASNELLKVLKDYDSGTIENQAYQIHEIEQAGDKIVHNIMDELNHSFITPIDREDIVLLTESLDNILDGLDSVPFQLDSYLITEIRGKAIEITELIVEAMNHLIGVAKEFAKFKNSKVLGEKIAHVNSIEEQADFLYRSAVKELFSTEQDIFNVVKWKAVYRRLEDIMDDIEKTADVMAGLVIKNT
ncbi:DUF47 domain-containing protein [Vagococcus humatus]|uniref:DUF47 domain-containing protein n=2 Tax=Vagococcus humatus TaxID=1889241 RepID=A0A3S0GCJ1_9ENTE|nr:DUF47 domain-containing protein [Vagococcus humatus]